MVIDLLRLLLAVWALWLNAVAQAEDSGVPNPLGLQQALAYAERHPRARLGGESPQGFPRRQPLYLDCHRLAYSSTSGIDNRRNRPLDPLIAPVAAQQMEILERFFDVLLADLTYARYNESMAVAYVQFDRASSRRELGQYSDLQVLELEVAYQEVLRRRAASEVSQRVTRSLLAQAIGHPRDLPRDLIAPALPVLPEPLPALDDLVAAAWHGNPRLVTLGQGRNEAARQLIDMELRQQLLELLLRLEALQIAGQHARTSSAWRDLRLEESRTLYEQEVRADLGFAMSQQTKARLDEQRVVYCRALAWAELNALRGEPVWPHAHREAEP